MMLRKTDTDTLITYTAQFFGALVGVVIIKLFAFYLSPDQFGALLSSRRIIGMALPLMTLNLSLSLARYNGTNGYMRKNFFFISITISFFIWLLLVFIATIFGEQFTNYLFGDILYLPFFHNLLIFFFASATHNLFTGYWRGLQRFKIMNLLTTGFHLSNVLILIVLIIAEPDKIVMLNRYYLILTIVTLLINATIYTYYESRAGQPTTIDPQRIKSEVMLVKEFLYYGYMRLPGGIFYALLFMIPVLVATNVISLSSAANVGIVISVANLVFLFGFPLNLLILPKYALYQKEDSTVQLKQKIQSSVDSSFTFPLLISPAIYLFSEEIIIILFDPKYYHAVFYIQLFSVVAGLFLAYISLRGLLDGLKTHPYANYVTGLGVLVSVISMVLFMILEIGEVGIVLGFILGIFSMFMSNMLIIRSKFEIQVLTRQNLVNMAVSITGMMLIYLLYSPSESPELAITDLIVKIVLFTVYCAASIKIFMSSKKRWAY
jgi:O-antigen/teichoic acid export membrane protein